MHNGKLGKMRGELCKTTDDGESIFITTIDACFLKAKFYCYTSVEEEEEKKIKRITKATIKNEITIADYKNAIFEAKSKYVTN